jgi:2-methylcitrate dehydratase PrpD
MNPEHYTRGWHATSTIGTIGAAAAVARLLRLESDAAARCLAIAASEASGVKENFGTMTKPLHAGLAARNGVMAALLARDGVTASDTAFDGPQGFLAAMGGDRALLDPGAASLGDRWEVLETGVTLKLYPSCAGTHPALDAILDLRQAHGFSADDVEAVTIGVDAVTPTILIYPRPTTGLEARFSMHYCAAAALATGTVDLDTFEPDAVNDPRITALLPRVTMTVDDTLRREAPALTQARVTIRLRQGGALSAYADGARGYPAHPATTQERETKFRTCAGRALGASGVEAALRRLQSLDTLADVRELTAALGPAGALDGARQMSAP